MGTCLRKSGGQDGRRNGGESFGEAAYQENEYTGGFADEIGGVELN